MTRMWRGPSQDVKDSYSDPLAVAITRRCTAHGVHVTLRSDGKSAEVFQLEKQSGDWYRADLGVVNGLSAVDTLLRVAHDFTPFDREFVAQKIQFIVRKAERLVLLVRDEIKLCAEIDALIEAIRV